ncbi:hypothetical protein C1645_836130 [Glomus cerebriforme]|uniref:Uncharacterized protein n=1 Tax=Glomus cerebriforme TaxID=658196 RepID=A0A397SCC2_9GLOM|nr:hypothetical protein C1645_836130 [Glomus cerebriforme]
MLITRVRLINISKDQASAGYYVFDIDSISLSHETIECLRTWPSEDDFKEAIHIEYHKAVLFAKYLQIDNQTASSMQQFICHDKHLLDDQDNLGIVDDNDDQYQNLAGIKNYYNILLIIFKQFETFDPLFTPEGFLYFKALIAEITGLLNLNNANHLINELTNDLNIQENCRNRRKELRNIVDANVSEFHPLILGGYLIIYSDNKLCIAQIISMYEKQVNIYLNVYDNLWTNTCEAGGKLFAHIPAKEVLYYFDSSPFDSQENLEIFWHFKTPEMISDRAKIFYK